MNSKYKISILIPVYQVEKYIEKCINSVYQNTIIQDCEIIIVNDNTPDKSMTIINQLLNNNYSNLISNTKIINNTTNMGIAFTRNVLLENATGEYILFIDSDDWVEKDYFEKMYDCAKENDSDLVGCNTYIENKKAEKRRVILLNDGYSNIKAWLRCETSCWLWIKLIKRSIIEENKLRFNTDLRKYEDCLFCIQMFYYAKKVNYFDEYLYHYLIRNTSASNSIKKYDTSIYIVESINKIEEFLYSKFNSVNELFNDLNYAKIQKKRWVILSGSYKSQKAFLSIWPEINDTLKKVNIKKTDKIILSNSYLSKNLLFLKNIKKILFNKLKIKDFLEK